MSQQFPWYIEFTDIILICLEASDRHTDALGGPNGQHNVVTAI